MGSYRQSMAVQRQLGKLRLGLYNSRWILVEVLPKSAHLRYRKRRLLTSEASGRLVNRHSMRHWDQLTPTPPDVFFSHGVESVFLVAGGRRAGEVRADAGDNAAGLPSFSPLLQGKNED